MYVLICGIVCLHLVEKRIYGGENLNATSVFWRFVTTLSKQRQINCDEHAYIPPYGIFMHNSKQVAVHM